MACNHFALGFFSVFSCTDSKDKEEVELPYKLILQLPASSIESALVSIGQPGLTPLVKYGIDVYTYQYDMVYKGKTIKASGLISVPTGQVGKNFPVLSFQHGTMVQKYEAPSVSALLPVNQSIIAIASMGYVVSYPDLVGFGTSASEFHPYLVKADNVTASITMLESIYGLADGAISGVSVNDSLFLAGYSQGGWITLAMLEQMEKTNHEWKNIATVCGAGPYYPELLMEHIIKSQSFEQPYYIPYVLMGYKEANILNQPITDFINEPFASKIPDLFNGNNSGSQINLALTTNMAELFTENFRANYGSFNELKSILTENGIHSWPCLTPLKLVHGALDTYVPSFVSDTMYRSFLSKQTENVELIIYPNLDHNSAAMPSIADALHWFNEFRK